MMQMLEAGGLTIFTDKAREADASNPRGYYEHEAVTSLKRSGAFLKDAKGSTVKVIANLLPHLPSKYKYRIVFLNRDLHEVLGSQQKMLLRDGKRVREDALPLNLLQKYEQTLDFVKSWMRNQRNVEFLEIDYADLVHHPFEKSLLINQFFNEQLQPEAMAMVPDASLYRERSKQSTQV